MKQFKVFISGAITNIPDYNRTAFNKADLMLTALGHIVLNPVTLPLGLEYEEYMSICMAMVDVCDVVYFLKDSDRSKGSNEEYYYATKHGKIIWREA